jgi:hypothetical protein
MRTASFAVFQSEDSVPAVCGALAGEIAFSAITFDADTFAPSEGVVRVARSLTAARFVLFENASNHCDENAFDLVIPALSHPSRWLKQLHDAMEASRDQRERAARQLRQDCATLQANLQAIRAESARVRVNPIDFEPLWR